MAEAKKLANIQADILVILLRDDFVHHMKESDMRKAGALCRNHRGNDQRMIMERVC